MTLIGWITASTIVGFLVLVLAVRARIRRDRAIQRDLEKRRDW